MLKKLISLLCAFFLLLMPAQKEPIEKSINIEMRLPPVQVKSFKNKKVKNKMKLLKLMAKIEEEKEYVINLIPEKTSINYFNHYKYYESKIKEFNKQYTIYSKQYDEILRQEEEARRKAEEEKKRKLEELKRQQEQEKIQTISHSYPTAATIWQYLRNCRYSNSVCAGILGNIMAEVGGQTLSIQPYIYGGGGGYYGICQWSLQYFPDVAGRDLTGQLNYLVSTIYNSFGGIYSTFLNSSSPESAALLFAQYYERCASYTYYQRQINARYAYNYFVG